MLILSSEREKNYQAFIFEELFIQITNALLKTTENFALKQFRKKKT